LCHPAQHPDRHTYSEWQTNSSPGNFIAVFLAIAWNFKAKN